VGAADIVALLDAVRAKNFTILINMTGGAHSLYLTNGPFDLAKWKPRRTPTTLGRPDWLKSDRAAYFREQPARSPRLTHLHRAEDSGRYQAAIISAVPKLPVLLCPQQKS
jgi:hypothetical protein